MNLGRAIKLCRTQRNLNQSDLAERADISVSYLSLLERGKRDPNFSTIQNIASALNVPFNILAFLAADENDLTGMSPELIEKLSYTALKAIESSNHETQVH